MKKYIKPAVVEVKMENEAILAASNEDVQVLSAGSGTDAMANDFDLDWDEE